MEAKGSKLQRSLLRKGEGVQLVAHCAQPGQWFPQSPAFKDWLVSSLGPKKVFQLSKPRKTAFPSVHGRSANLEKSIKIWQNLLHTQGVIKRKVEQTRIANVYLPLMSNDIYIEFSVCRIEWLHFIWRKRVLDFNFQCYQFDDIYLLMTKRFLFTNTR